ncbi:hypothetical protein [Nocardia gipuzkoensis]
MPDRHLIPALWTPIHGYTRLLDRLRQLKHTDRIEKVVAIPYAWRLSNRYNAARLAQIIERELGAWRDSDPTRANS